MESLRADQLGDWILDRHRTAAGSRTIVGICGPPGVGKSTLAAQLDAELAASVPTAVVSMDGFHLPNAELDRAGLRSVKGAPETFDAVAFVEAVASLRAPEPSGTATALPSFDRAADEPVADGIVVVSETQIVVVEGNYLLLEEAPWTDLRSLLDVALYLDLDDRVRRARLIARHVEFGRSPDDAAAWVDRSDETNARRIATTRTRADAVVSVG